MINNTNSKGSYPCCDNCGNSGVFCERDRKIYPGGHVKNSCTGDIAGIIFRCVNWIPVKTKCKRKK